MKEIIKIFIDQLDRFTVLLVCAVLSATCLAIWSINHVFIDNVLLKDAQSLSSNIAYRINEELQADRTLNIHRPFENTLSGFTQDNNPFNQVINQKSLKPETLSNFKAASLNDVPSLKSFIDKRMDGQAYLSEIQNYVVYLGNGTVFLPQKLFQDNHLHRQYEYEPEILSSVKRVFYTGKSLYSLRENPESSSSQHFVPLFHQDKVVAVVMLEAFQSRAGLKMASAVSNAVSMTTFAGLPIVVLVIYLVWAHLRESAKAKQEISFLEHHDQLTALPNRTGFYNQLRDLIQASSIKAEKFAVFSIDIDGFNHINDSVGHDIADQYLIGIANEIGKLIPSSAILSRLSGDEFAAIFPGISTAEEAANMASEIFEKLAEPFDVQGEDIYGTASIGIAFYPDNGLDEIALMKNTDMALKRAKADGGNMFRFFEPAMDQALQRYRLLERGLFKAIAEDEFEIYYQPQVELSGAKVIGYEALLRWRHPELGMISPAEFIPILEKTKMIVEVGDYVLNRACEEALSWPDEQRLAVNLSPVQFEFQNVPNMVSNALANSGFPAERLELEITESVLMSDSEEAINMLKELKELGVQIAMDDFGTGYSSLSYITEFEFDKIKIDRSFVTSIHTDERARAIISTIIGLGRALDIMITAEGIETSEQLILIQSAGCHYGQGYLFGKPEPLDEIIANQKEISDKLTVLHVA